MSFQQGLSGLNASSKNLEVIGNNIANANTFGALRLGEMARVLELGGLITDTAPIAALDAEYARAAAALQELRGG